MVETNQTCFKEFHRDGNMRTPTAERPLLSDLPKLRLLISLSFFLSEQFFLKILLVSVICVRSLGENSSPLAKFVCFQERVLMSTIFVTAKKWVLCRRQSRNWDRTAGKESRPAKAPVFAGANPTVICLQAEIPMTEQCRNIASWRRSKSPPA
jgi:hypothetical protein